MDLEDKIAKVKQHKSNCVGTALYLLGLQQRDRYVHPPYLEELSEQGFQKIKSIRYGAAAVFFDETNRVVHMGVVLQDGALAHRRRAGGIFEVIPLRRINYSGKQLGYYKAPVY